MAMSKLAERARSLKLQLAAMTDEARGADPLALAAALPAGAWLIFRHYAVPDRSILAIKLARICRARRVKLLIAGDLQLAAAAKAGLHLPERQAATPAIRLWRRRGGFMSVAAHGRLGLRRGADAALLSPVFATASHPTAKPLGLLALRRLTRSARLPVLALGGVTAERLVALKSAAIFGVAAVGALIPPLRRRRPG
jgi:thiamine-phosphate pyrophosphorylase